MLKLVLWVLPAAAFGFRLRGVTPERYLGVTTLPDRHGWFESFWIIAGFVFVVILVESILGGKSLSLAGAANWLTGGGVLLLVVTPLLEELLFRGMILRELCRLTPLWVANLSTSVLFVGIHCPFWLTHDGFSPEVLGNAVGVFMFSLVAGWLWLRSASIWPPTLAHVANNFLASLLVANPS